MTLCITILSIATVRRLSFYCGSFFMVESLLIWVKTREPCENEKR